MELSEHSPHPPNPDPPSSSQTPCMLLQWWLKLCHHVQQLRPGKEMKDLPRGADDGVHAVMTCWWSLMNTSHPPSSTQTLCMLQWWRKLCHHVQQLRLGKELKDLPQGTDGEYAALTCGWSLVTTEEKKNVI